MSQFGDHFNALTKQKQFLQFNGIDVCIFPHYRKGLLPAEHKTHYLFPMNGVKLRSQLLWGIGEDTRTGQEVV